MEHLDKHELPVLSAKRAPAMGAEKKNPIHKSLKMRNIFGGKNSIYKLWGRKIYSGAQGCPTCFSLVPRKQSNNGNTKKIPNKTHTNKTTTVKQKKEPKQTKLEGKYFWCLCPSVRPVHPLLPGNNTGAPTEIRYFWLTCLHFNEILKQIYPIRPSFQFFTFHLSIQCAQQQTCQSLNFWPFSRPSFHLIQFGCIFVPVPMFVFGRPDRPRNGLGSLLQIKTVGTSSSSEHISLKRVKMVSGGEDGRVVKKWIYVPGDRPAYRALSSFS